jgi:hypothetical protein
MRRFRMPPEYSNMKIQALNDQGDVIWERGQDAGMASCDYVRNGMQQQIIRALTEAVQQAEGELLAFDDADRVSDVGASGT